MEILKKILGLKFLKSACFKSFLSIAPSMKILSTNLRVEYMYIYVYLYIYQDPQKSKNVDWPNNALNVHTAASLFSNQFADLKCVYCLELPIRPNPCIFGQIWISRIQLFLNVGSRFCGGSNIDVLDIDQPHTSVLL